jgi:hypothetical protein
MKEEKDFFDVEELPLYKKGQEIAEVVFCIADIIPEDESLNMVKDFMCEDVLVMTSKIIAAHFAPYYDIKMESAIMIRKAAMDMQLHYQALRMFGFEDFKYYNIVLNLLEEYRLLFIEWIKDFEPCEYVEDRWGLFNVPGKS